MIIKREGKENKYYYTIKGVTVTDEVILDYIKSLVIPPAYRNVEIYYVKKPKILFSGIDSKDRVQCIYSKSWCDNARSLKLCNLISFGETLPSIISDMKSQMESKKPTKNKIIATLLRVITFCYFRIGNVKYEKLYTSYGISTVTKKHIKFNKNGAHISFIGKKGVLNTCTVIDPSTINALKSLVNLDQSDPHIFVYYEDGEYKHIKHTEVNDWLNKYGPFTSKLFRTFDSNIILLKLLGKDNPSALSPNVRKKKIVNAVREVSTMVHNTSAICKKDYIDPEIIDIYLKHPVRFKKLFITPSSDTRIKFINYLKQKCK